VATEIAPFVVAGITELELRAHVERLAATHGSTGHWTPVTTRIGIGTLVAHPAFPMQDRAARAGDTVFVDVTPIIDGWLGDHCVSFVIGDDDEAQRLIDDCRDVQQHMIDAVTPGMPASDLFAIGAALLAEKELKLLDLLDNFGHSIGREFATDGFIDAFNHTPMYGAWTIEPQVGRRGRGAKYEDMVWLSREGDKTLI
jgi:Xaa-Pro aminopeptidase